MVIASGLKAIRSVGITMDDLAAVILVGGKSSRMGQDKASLPYKGKRLVDVVADAVREAGIENIYVSGEIDGYTSLPDLLLDRGPMGGICSSAVRLHKQYERVLFIPVDMPHINAELLNLLIAESTACHFKNHPLPCQLLLERKTMRQLDAAAQTLARKQKLSVKSFLVDLGSAAITPPEHLQKALTNTNTPEEWQEVIS
jgi:molybdopterin-guanine dinucleotide biosynthesis protein A